MLRLNLDHAKLSTLLAPWCHLFFTVNLLERRGNDLLVHEIDLLRDVAQKVRRKHPFIIHAWVVLPEHLHCVIELPEADFWAHANYVHFNPVKHGWVKCVYDWPYSTFCRWVDLGIYSLDWGKGKDAL